MSATPISQLLPATLIKGQQKLIRFQINKLASPKMRKLKS